MKPDPRQARHLLRQCDFGALATQSGKVPGYPFVSHVALALDGAGRPLLLLSALAEHTRNLAADARASLMVSLPGESPQAQPRLTLLGDLRSVEVEEAQRARYLRYHPDGKDYLGFGDFSFYRLEVQEIRLVAGFAQAGWIAADAWACRPLAESHEGPLLERLQAAAPPGWLILGVDWEGLDAQEFTGERRRLVLPHDNPAITTIDLERAARQVLNTM